MTKTWFGLDFLVLTSFVSSCLQAGTAQELTIKHNEFCLPRPTLVAVDYPSFNLFPYYVTLHRCGGSVSYTSPRLLTCAPATTQEVKITARNLYTSGFEVIMEKNHTSCKRECTDTPNMCDPEMETWDDQNCGCKCKYPDGPPEPCPTRFKWNPSTCSCKCNEEEHATQCLKEGKVWSSDKCGCACIPRAISRCKSMTDRVLDENTCRCVIGEVVFGARTSDGKESGVSTTVMFGIVIGELLVLLFIFDLILCITKKWGFMYYLGKSIGKAVSGDAKHSGPPLSPSSNHDRTTYL